MRIKSNYEYGTQRVVAITLFCLATVSAATLFTGVAWGLLGWSNPLMPPILIFSGFLLSQILAALGVMTLRSARFQMKILKEGKAEKFIHALENAQSWKDIEWTFKYTPQVLARYGMMDGQAAHEMREMILEYAYIQHCMFKLQWKSKDASIEENEDYKLLKEAKQSYKDLFSDFKNDVILPNLASLPSVK